ncbi:FAD-dependent oxidoreductase [Nguyenibacter sp. L1]|uniref:NAD(P)/FAD-dependent oxidoreductase n=1 Tax=Nguyenibacter sp. L1 TaxID=3049350 RepID=UPI002B46450F|nr:FAD-dependent oxidoreductase [Nguyenibacter sp. L1]WRH87190.1 FAD-dependent oxidoreductase [Nguyenibacter sp. L1]
MSGNGVTAGAGRPLPASLYAETARAAAPTPALAADIAVGTVLIGGGITALSAALHLAEAGHDVAVLEANVPGWGASGRNGGQVNPGLKPPPSQVERDFGPERGGRLARAAWNAPDLVFELIARHAIDCAPARGGTLRAATADDQVPALRQLAEECRARGGPVVWLDRAEIAARTGATHYRAGLLDARGGQVNPLGYARGLAEAAMRRGAGIYGGTRALSVRRIGGCWHVGTRDGSVRAERVVFATNGYADGLWDRLRRSVVPVSSAILATAPLPEAARARILAAREVLYELGEITTYYRIDDAGRLLIGGRSQCGERSGPDAFPFLKRHALRLWPFLSDVAWTHGWNGRVAVTLDHYPHWHEPLPGILACVGYNGRGIAMATLLGREIARRALAAAAEEMLLPPGALRPIACHGAWPIGVSAKILQGRVADALSRLRSGERSRAGA